MGRFREIATGTHLAPTMGEGIMRARMLVFVIGMVIGACSGGDPNGDLPLEDDPSAGPSKKAGSGSGTSRGGGNTLPEGRTDDAGPPAPEGSQRDGGTDAGGGSTTPPTTPPPTPTTPFERIEVRYPIVSGLFLTQCTPDGGKTQLVWKTSPSAPDAYSRYADPVYTQLPGAGSPCGTTTSGEYPIVLTAFAAGAIPDGAFVVKCASKGTAQVYKVTTSVGGSPAATWQYPQVDATCP